jgi:sugar lactone lactonase YvrE
MSKRIARGRQAMLLLLACCAVLAGWRQAASAADPKSSQIAERILAGRKTGDLNRHVSSFVLLAQKDDDAKADAQEDHPFRLRQKAPSLDGGVEWINTAGPIDLKQLRGKFVLLDFWTYCCINCMHILPQLKKLEHAYPNEIVVIGVHSAKFATEQDSKNIREAIERYEIEHPVVNDAMHKIWDKFEVTSWPSLRVIDPEGNVVAEHGGEIDFESLDAFFKDKMPYYRRKGLLKPGPPPPTGESAGAKIAATPLRYPGKILADEKSDRLYIADSNHNRIVVAQLNGTLIDTIGSGEIGATDGSYARASFDHPQGLALAGDVLYVADTENHMLRKVDLKKKQVHVLAGTGKQGHGWPGIKGLADGAGDGTRRRFVGPPLKTALSSPWALWVEGHELYVAMAGTHQIWKMSLSKPEIGPFAGNSREDIVNGPHLPARPGEEGFCSFAQPSGLSSDGSLLYVADSEGSSIRAVPFDPAKDVTTVVGTAWLPRPARLFTFGDVDGRGEPVRLQHALDVLYHDGMLYVADTYNNKIKIVDPRQSTSETLAGTGKSGEEDDPAEFDEPAGLAYAGGKLYVADTNNHAIRTIDLNHGNKVATLEIQGLKPPQTHKANSKPTFPGAAKIELPAAKLKSVDGKVRLQVALQLPEGYKINPLAPLRYLVESTGEKGPIDRDALGKLATVEEPSATFDIELPAAETGSEKLKVSLGYYYCQSGSEGVCKAGSVIWTLPVTLSADASETSVQLPFKVAH